MNLGINVDLIMWIKKQILVVHSLCQWNNIWFAHNKYSSVLFPFCIYGWRSEFVFKYDLASVHLLRETDPLVIQVWCKRRNLEINVRNYCLDFLTGSVVGLLEISNISVQFRSAKWTYLKIPAKFSRNAYTPVSLSETDDQISSLCIVMFPWLVVDEVWSNLNKFNPLKSPENSHVDRRCLNRTAATPCVDIRYYHKLPSRKKLQWKLLNEDKYWLKWRRSRYVAALSAPCLYLTLHLFSYPVQTSFGLYRLEPFTTTSPGRRHSVKVRRLTLRPLAGDKLNLTLVKELLVKPS